mmetsp:Transcript_8414/g.20946  ORF Transcript_8414/g.20946 Transcript_8414/m.20946 type:complete len:239 (-) Transcript_8414:1232-1948(-)
MDLLRRLLLLVVRHVPASREREEAQMRGPLVGPLHSDVCDHPHAQRDIPRERQRLPRLLPPRQGLRVRRAGTHRRPDLRVQRRWCVRHPHPPPLRGSYHRQDRGQAVQRGCDDRHHLGTVLALLRRIVRGVRRSALLRLLPRRKLRRHVGLVRCHVRQKPCRSRRRYRNWVGQGRRRPLIPHHPCDLQVPEGLWPRHRVRLEAHAACPPVAALCGGGVHVLLLRRVPRRGAIHEQEER